MKTFVCFSLPLILLLDMLSDSQGFFATSATRGRAHTALFLSEVTETTITPKDAVKLFGRLAEKYIVLDSSGGMCCYSACKDCEFRLPGGGYRMADQSAARPKWIPSYETRIKGSEQTVVASKWSTELFESGKTCLNKQEFCEAVRKLEYAPPLGGPYVGASAATLEENEPVLEQFFDLLVGNGSKKDEVVLTKNSISQRLKELAGGEEGHTWAMFSKAILET